MDLLERSAKLDSFITRAKGEAGSGGAGDYVCGEF